MIKRLLFVSASIAIAVAVASCGKADVQTTSSQIAAKVNGDEISVHQINSEIVRSKDKESAPEQAGQSAAQILERIIDQELLVQQALQAKLDRDPQVMQAIESAKRQILAQAYIERAATAAAPERQEEITKFYAGNPVLFERRRIYRVHELVVIAPQEKFGALQAVSAGAKSLNDVEAWLKSQKLPFQVAISNKPAEQIPMKILPQVYQMHDGQIAVFPTSRGASVLQLLQSTEAPMAEQQAAPIIERYLLNRKRLEAAQAAVRKLREKAKIEYVGEFATAHPAAAQPVLSSVTPRSSVEEENGPIEKGLAGLR